VRTRARPALAVATLALALLALTALLARDPDGPAALVRHADSAVGRSLEQRSERLNGFVLQLRSLDPRRTLARGYAVVQLRENKLAITSVKQVKGRDRLDVHVRDGRFPAEVSRQYGF